ncbi:hypothetical protein IU501_06835 [Nocardia otitidiscaviarum]|uniref:hypothetical protein n=1 Tax=Nocardia otitidiscaviarum TaxID=1823 RepID=UPI0004A76891|nr:hypothetical protein [Nocardia otitidiscaviarum]MBF6132715.1 hypothetical protein [Nocardia otitidiscaviarum]MBF6486134.1 hypothetical protein [Nocardia otitidiscaviarum]
MTSELSQPNQHPGQHPPQPEQPWNSAAGSEDQATRPHSAVPSLSTGQPQAAAPQTLDARSPADAQPPADTPPRAEANPQAEAKPYPGEARPGDAPPDAATNPQAVDAPTEYVSAAPPQTVASTHADSNPWASANPRADGNPLPIDPPTQYMSTPPPPGAHPRPADAPTQHVAMPPSYPAAPPSYSAGYPEFPGVTPYGAAPAHHPTAPPYPATYQPYPDAAVTPSGPPRPVQNAYYLMLAGAVLTVLSTLIGFLQLPSLREEMAETTEGVFTQSELDTLVAVSFGVGVAFSLISVGLWVWMAFANRAGKNWARVTATVLFGLYTASMLFAVIGIFMPEARTTVVSTMFSVVLWCVGLAAVILLWNKQSTAYFRPAPAGYAPYAGPAGMPYPGQPGAPYAGSGTPPTAGGPYSGPPGA